MTINAWPEEVPHIPLRESWSMRPFLEPLASEMDGGNVRLRSRPGDEVKIVSQAIVLPASLYASTLEPFLLENKDRRILMPMWLGGGCQDCLVQLSEISVNFYGTKVRVGMTARVLREVEDLEISGTPVTTATQNVAYFGFQVSATGGVPGYTFSVSAGALPTGLSLNADTGVVSGTPTVAGTFAGIVIRVTDDAGTTADLDPFTLTVS